MLTAIAPRLVHVLGGTATLWRASAATSSRSCSRARPARTRPPRSLGADRRARAPAGRSTACRLEVAASIGIACFPQHGRTVEELLQHADVALYCAKASTVGLRGLRGGGGRAQPRPPRARRPVATRHRARRARRSTTSRRSPLNGERTAAVEALVRWRPPAARSASGPDGFIPLAEQTGLIKPLTRQVLDAALRQCSAPGGDRAATCACRSTSPTRSLLDPTCRRRCASCSGAAGCEPSCAAARDHREPDRRRPAARHERARRTARHSASASRSTTSGPGFSSLPSSSSCRSTRSRSTSRS